MVKVHGCLIVYENNNPRTQELFNNPIIHLLDSQTYYPLGMLIEVSKEKQDVTDKLLTNIFDETITLKERAIAYMSGFDKLVKIMADDCCLYFCTLRILSPPKHS